MVLSIGPVKRSGRRSTRTSSRRPSKSRSCTPSRPGRRRSAPTRQHRGRKPCGISERRHHQPGRRRDWLNTRWNPRTRPLRPSSPWGSSRRARRRSDARTGCSRTRPGRRKGSRRSRRLREACSP
ncbi:hypothetical protein AKJ08_0161 [Vulgatibacter incomptus]|uniref:Uncharacterized protein n=1 Tax=Vulgatibacter incomptus TaxID=1391653 RepID=A0A0K1P9K1_9BACT|nr:hypothetical protein AKJ08_0161 [Vulgatibacter incomptus]